MINVTMLLRMNVEEKKADSSGVKVSRCLNHKHDS